MKSEEMAKEYKKALDVEVYNIRNQLAKQNVPSNDYYPSPKLDGKKTST